MRRTSVVHYSVDILTNATLSNESRYLFLTSVKPSVSVPNPPGRHIPTMVTGNSRNLRIEGQGAQSLRRPMLVDQPVDVVFKVGCARRSYAGRDNESKA